MTDFKDKSFSSNGFIENDSAQNDSKKNESIKKGPLSFLAGALTSLLLGWVCLLLSERVVIYFTSHPPNYSSAIALSISSGFKTLVIGMSFLATFTFSFIGLGLTIVFFRSLFDARGVEQD